MMTSIETVSGTGSVSPIWSKRNSPMKHVLAVMTVCSIVNARSQAPFPMSSENMGFNSMELQNSLKQSTPYPPDEAEIPIETIYLKLCEGYRGRKGNTEIATYSIEEMIYYMANFTFNDVLTHCPTGEKPRKDRVETVSISAYYKTVKEAGNGSTLMKYYLLRNEIFILDNGYLSLGNNDTAWYYSPNEYCVEDVRGANDAVVLKLRTCEPDPKRPIFHKCCPVGTILGPEGCIDDESIYPDILDGESLKPISMEKVNPVIISQKLTCGSGERESWEIDDCNNVFHPVTDNRVAFIGAHRTREFLEADMSKCFDSVYSKSGTKTFTVIYCAGNNTLEKDKESRISDAYMITMYVGATFNFLTSLVYLITWKKQNIHGRTLCSCTSSLFFMQVFLGTAHLLGNIGTDRNTVLCYINSIGGQYFMIAAFTWLLVVNVDLWRTFRSLKANDRTSFKRFLAYSGFGWGFPLLVSIVSVSLEFTFQCRASGVPVPEYAEHYCFVIPWAQGYYVYYILGVLNPLSYVFAALTLIGLYRFKKDARNLRSSKREDDTQNILLFLKLGVVMGLTWIFEVISWAATGDEDEKYFTIWIIFDLYNSLSAILIFIIFVCKRTTLNLLEQTIPVLKGVSVAFTKFTSTFTGDPASNETVSTAAGGNSSSSNGKGTKKSIEMCSARYQKVDGSTNGGFD